MKPPTSNSMVIKGRIREGLKESSFFTHVPWVREQFINKLDIDPYPGERHRNNSPRAGILLGALLPCSGMRENKGSPRHPPSSPISSIEN
jgi:hypothetical protein